MFEQNAIRFSYSGDIELKAIPLESHFSTGASSACLGAFFARNLCSLFAAGACVLLRQPALLHRVGSQGPRASQNARHQSGLSGGSPRCVGGPSSPVIRTPAVQLTRSGIGQGHILSSTAHGHSLLGAPRMTPRECVVASVPRCRAKRILHVLEPTLAARVHVKCQRRSTAPPGNTPRRCTPPFLFPPLVVPAHPVAVH